MSTSLIRRCAAPVTGAALVAGMLLVGSAQASAQVTTTSFKSSCQASAAITVHKTKDDSVIIDAPVSVKSGDNFTFRIQPGSASYPNSDSGATTTNLSRLKFDFDVPNNTTFVKATVVPGTGINLGGVAANLLQVNTGGVPDATGTVLRLSGNNQVIANGTSNSTGGEGGIVAPKLKKNLDGSSNGNGDSWFQMPAVDVTVKAGVAGTAITPKVRTGGNAANYNDDQNFSTQLAQATFLGGTQWAPTRCTPRDSSSAGLNKGAGVLATIDVTPADATTTTTLDAPTISSVGAEITLSASVAPSPAGGTVQFKDGETDLGAPIAVSGGTASMPYTFTTTGAHSVTAVFSGVDGFGGSTSAATVVNVAIASAPTTTTLTAPAEVATGASIDLKANVSPAPAGGTVQFKDGANNIGGPRPVIGGNAALSQAFSTPGAHQVTAVYSGATGFATSTSAPATVTVSVPDSATTTVLNLPGTAATGSTFNVSASVSPAPTAGTVQFKDSNDNLGAPVVLVNGFASMTQSFATPGSHSITAVFSGAPGFGTSTSPAKNITIDDTVKGTVTTATVPGSAAKGAAVDLRADVVPVPAGGTVQFAADGIPIGDPVGLDAGHAVLSYGFHSAGTHSVTATYSGDPTFAGSTSAAQTISVTSSDIGTATTVTAPATASTGKAVQLTATTTPAPAGGTVQFKDGGVLIGAPTKSVNGTASISHVFADAGPHSITAVFSGGVGFDGSTAPAVNVDVSVADQGTVTLLSVPGEAKTGVATPMWASVFELPGGELVSTGGTVQFKDGDTALGAPIAVVNGVATLNQTFSSVGAHQISAVFSGGSGRTGSTADGRTVNVTATLVSDISTATILTAPDSATVGDQVTVSANVVASAVANGTVQFMDGETPLGESVALVNGVATLTHTFPSAGTHAITAVYSGAQGFTTSTSSASTLTITAATTGGGTGGGSADFLPFGS
ncbi:beta strand repeat-containing protein [Rhodococcus sp. OK302]|uniref:beta strand repeat-containing protein n=1 Tax=Rhodococcus sp. OK302 TaxID=1882769 RepID=UPI000B93E080|nr:Ig-like domain-containing protein [Rhodococcus sp. OK302]OYD67548.1 Ig-like domain-containing protein [Rhodococcus sp. OK302]